MAAPEARLDQDARYIDIAAPLLGEEELRALREPIESGWLTQGPKVAAFERAFAERHGVRHARGVTSCTAGLHLALAALDIGPGDEVIVPSFTWVATANAVLYCGATPVFVDVDRATFNIDPDDVRRKVTDRTAAVIVVHLFGRCADVDAVRAAVPAEVAIVEDAACAVGAEYKGKSAGGLGTIGVFSFHPRKSITTGEGGMVTTDNDRLAERIGVLRSHGASVPEERRHQAPRPHYLPEFDEIGFNYRMTDLQGAIGLVQLAKLDRILAERRHWANHYRERLAGLDWLRLPTAPNDGLHAWQAFVTYVEPDRAPVPRDAIMDRLHEMGVATRPGTHAVHMLNYHSQRFALAPDDLPAARDCERNSMAIPLHNRMTEADYDYVVDCLRAF